jgi:hypothetical protein
MRSLSAALIVILLGAVPASAAIRISDSRYENGTLIVAGQARPNQEVALDGKYTTKADGNGHFEFKVKYRPPTCMPDITAGGDSYSAVVTNCLLDEATASDRALKADSTTQ